MNVQQRKSDKQTMAQLTSLYWSFEAKLRYSEGLCVRSPNASKGQ